MTQNLAGYTMKPKVARHQKGKKMLYKLASFIIHVMVHSLPTNE